MKFEKKNFQGCRGMITFRQIIIIVSLLLLNALLFAIWGN